MTAPDQHAVTRPGRGGGRPTGEPRATSPDEGLATARAPRGRHDGPPTPRFAGIAALPGVLALVHAAYRGEQSRAGWTTEADLLEGGRTTAGLVRDLMVSTRDAVLILGDESAPLACCAVGVHDGRATFGMFAVRPAAQGRGTGAAVLRAAEAYVHARWGAEALHLSVIGLRTELLAWYARRGYAPTGETEPFPYGDERYGRPLRGDLELVVLRRALG